MKLSGPGLLFAGRFLITVSISVLVMGLKEERSGSCRSGPHPSLESQEDGSDADPVDHG